MDHRTDDRRAILKESLDALHKAAEQLRYSIEKCSALPMPFTPQGLESIEALTSRFARTSDLFTHKAVRSLLYYLREDIASFLDAANFLEKTQIAPSANDVIEVRELRNEIAHEYSDRDTLELRDACLALSPTLFAMIEKLDQYTRDALRK